MKKFNLFLVLFCSLYSGIAQTYSDFDNLPLAPNSFYNGSDLSGGFSSGNAFFFNDYNTAWQSWSGFSYSNIKDSTTAGFTNQYSAITASGFNNSSTYVVGVDYGSAIVRLSSSSKGKIVSGAYITNATYGYLSMRDGDMFAKKFGGNSGNDPDWFKLTVKGWHNGVEVPSRPSLYLADFRFADNAQDYILRDWTWFDLSALGNVDSFQFLLTSSDTGQFGMNTPAYFCLDRLICSDYSNQAPVANTDYAEVLLNTDTTVNVLQNDFDITSTPLNITLVQPTLVPGATVTLDSTGNIYYQPQPGLAVVDTVLYSVCDAGGLCDTGTLVVRVFSTTSINNIAEINVTVYPNPLQGDYWVLNGDKTLEGQQLSINDFTGRIVYREIIQSVPLQIPAAGLPAGMYVLQAGESVIRLIKQ